MLTGVYRARALWIQLAGCGIFTGIWDDQTWLAEQRTEYVSGWCFTMVNNG